MYGYLERKITDNNKKEQNSTGIPDSLLQRAEAKAGMSLRDVRVHYNSDKPARVQALAYTKGNQIYVGPGQENYLSHELGHVVQQKEGRVKANTSVGGQPVNDESALEREADNFL